jgi:hypothetical protein
MSTDSTSEVTATDHSHAAAGTDSASGFGGRVIRIRRGIEPSEPAPAIEVPIKYDVALDSEVTTGVKDYLVSRRVQRDLKSMGYEDVFIHAIHSEEVQVPETELPKNTLRIYNWARVQPGYTSRTDLEEVYIQEFGERVRLSGGQDDCCLVDVPNLGPDVQPIYDLAGTVLAVCTHNQLAIIFDLFHSTNNQEALFRYIFDAFLSGKFSPLEDSFIIKDVPAASELFTRVFSAQAKAPDSEFIAKIKKEARVHFDKYLEVLKKNEATLRYITGLEEPTPEMVADRAKMVMDRIAANPLIAGISVSKDSIRLITPEIEAEFGKHKYIIVFPIKYNRDHPISIHYFDEEKRKAVPVDHNSGRPCMGSVYPLVDFNLLSGDWDMAVNLVMRALIGSGPGMKEAIKIAEAMRQGMENTAVKTPSNTEAP